MAQYDSIATFYLDFIERNLAQETSVLNVARQAILRLAGDVAGLRVCDVACGEGHLTRAFAANSAETTGVDFSAELLKQARVKSAEVTYIHDDAQSLQKLHGQQFDLVTSNLALMDIPDLSATFRAIAHITKSGGRFIFSILHPCFEAPFDENNAPFELDDNENFVAARVNTYTNEGHWTSGGDGIRGRIGAHHRMLSTYINELLAAGFILERLDEPTLPVGDYAHWSEQALAVLPRALIISAKKSL